ncbi:MAG: hypothetical protein FRX48_04095 [Lasallia pustulata]|uniref:SWIB/MDM2 domain n=1 Tax=Lasallia pustulata TaxID=136370 RepID=A0A1W5CTB3_9LECA|nr:MAG: hypothetical protein FRX48_04095 [Lasallia pustulata]SLM33975.1 SWIB/MDM2 domain [Lasallia pustulata]
MDLPPEVKASYATIIDSILAASDLETISEKRIRKGLQQAVEYDITPQKGPIKALIMARFDKFMAEKDMSPVANGGTAAVKHEPMDAKQRLSSPPETPSPSKRPQKFVKNEDELSDVVETPPPKKKRKAVTTADEDAAFAARLQAEENSRARPTRGGANRKLTTAKKKKKAPKVKRTDGKIKPEDDSDIGSTSDLAEKKVKKGGFHKPLTLSASLSALLDGEIQLSRPETVKRIWAYVRERDLQDPNDKRQIRCDEAMRAVFKQDRVHMFTMNKILSQNLYNPEE